MNAATEALTIETRERRTRYANGAASVPWTEVTVNGQTAGGVLGHGLTVTENTRVLTVCSRCYGGGCYAFDGETDTCYECGGQGTTGPNRGTVREAHAKNQRNARASQRRQEKAAAEAAARQSQQEAEFAQWADGHRDVVDYLADYTGTHPVLRDFAADVAQSRILTEKQADFAARLIAEDQAPKAEVPSGRVQITGTIKSVKLVDNDYSYSASVTEKMVVQCDGYRLHGTVPKSLLPSVTTGTYAEDLDALIGREVAFTATVKPGREAGFGFFSRPTKAEFTN